MSTLVHLPDQLRSLCKSVQKFVQWGPAEAMTTVRTLFETLTADQQRLYVHQLAASGLTAKAIGGSTGLAIEAVQRLLLTEARPTLTLARRKAAHS